MRRSEGTHDAHLTLLLSVKKSAKCPCGIVWVNLVDSLRAPFATRWPWNRPICPSPTHPTASPNTTGQRCPCHIRTVPSAFFILPLTLVVYAAAVAHVDTFHRPVFSPSCLASAQEEHLCQFRPVSSEFPPPRPVSFCSAYQAAHAEPLLSLISRDKPRTRT